MNKSNAIRSLLFTTAILLVLASGKMLCAQIVRTYSFHSFGDLEFAPRHVVYENDGQLVVIGATDTVNLNSATGRNIGRWTREAGLVELLPETFPFDPNLFINDVSKDGSVVVGFRSLISGAEGFRWTAVGGYEAFSPTTGSQLYGVDPEGSTFAGRFYPNGVSTPSIWSDLGVPEVLPYQAITGQPTAIDVVVDGLGNHWTCGSFGTVTRNDEEVYIDFYNPGGSGATDITLTENNTVRALVNGTVFCQVAGLKAAPTYIDFSIDDPTKFTLNPIPFELLSRMSEDGKVIVGDRGGFFGFPIHLWEENNDAWGIMDLNGTRSAHLGDLLQFYLTDEQQLEISLDQWSFASSFVPSNPTRDVAIFRNECVTKSAVVGYAFNPDGQREAFLVSVVSRELLLGDINLDCSVDLLDVTPFVAVLSSGTFQVEADTNQDGVVNLLDVSVFIELLSGG